VSAMARWKDRTLDIRDVMELGLTNQRRRRIIANSSGLARVQHFLFSSMNTVYFSLPTQQ
jgi:hypothetical protein